jgi:hypothetical protein
MTGDRKHRTLEEQLEASGTASPCIPTDRDCRRRREPSGDISRTRQTAPLTERLGQPKSPTWSWTSEHYEKYYNAEGDWWHLSDQEQSVFAIIRDRFPRMIMTWHCYDVFKLVASASTFDDELIEQARQLHPEWCGADGSAEEFADFAKEYAGLTHREAYAVYAKHDAWEVELKEQDNGARQKQQHQHADPDRLACRGTRREEILDPPRRGLEP